MSLIQRVLQRRTRCFPRLLICVVSILLISDYTFGSVEDLIRSEIERIYGDKVRIESINVYIPPGTKIENPSVKIHLREGYGEGSATIITGRRLLRAKLKVSWRVRVPVAVTDIERGEIITQDKVRWEDRYISKHIRDIPPENTVLSDYEAMRMIKSGEIIRKRFLRKRYLVKKGDVVRLFYRRGSIEISYEGEALENGYRGSLIRVRVLSSGKIIKGRVLSEGEVEIR